MDFFASFGDCLKFNSIYRQGNYVMTNLVEVTFNQTVPDESNLWSDHDRPDWSVHWSDWSALEVVFDQILPDGIDLW